MKRKILSYLLGWFFSVLLGFSWLWLQVNADATTCWAQEISQWMYCCEGIPTNVPCDSVVIEGCKGGCCWIKLNTNFPIIWNCIETKSNEANPTNAFPYMVWALTKIIMSLILVVCFILVIVSGIMWSADKPKEAKDLLKKVAITILLLWFSWVILRLINPNFFG